MSFIRHIHNYTEYDCLHAANVPLQSDILINLFHPVKHYYNPHCTVLKTTPHPAQYNWKSSGKLSYHIQAGLQMP